MPLSHARPSFLPSFLTFLSLQPVLDSTEGGRNHLYLSNIINKMISHGHGFVANRAEDCAQCGTPEKLEQFMGQVCVRVQQLEEPLKRC